MWELNKPERVTKGLKQAARLSRGGEGDLNNALVDLCPDEVGRWGRTFLAWTKYQKAEVLHILEPSTVRTDPSAAPC